MTILSNSLVLPTNLPLHLSSGSHLKPADQSFGSASPTNLSFNSNRLGKLQLSTSSRPLMVQALYSDGERLSSASIFVGSFVLGGLLVGALGCVFAPQVMLDLQMDAKLNISFLIFPFWMIKTYSPETWELLFISKALAGVDRKDLMKRLPKFIYDEEKALEKTRKILTEKIAQLNSAIDDVSAQLRSEDAPNGVAMNTDEIEAAI
ncbi:uncharacterized protein LOC111282159 isoform X1 [Durio zibethinus]|uniref:Uncharacterized protein LOC111282159 isoform X1 n=1 Tax=Durio zibethinus TaxID=66656 RepID=A0A6P5XD22_DURZI|nr:uncharacterized protein LOC111282159 isoform X1 [Durio zibethinus]XP_022726979.1 uncharacterized protein LOC111282159 isoform X1 [Durio zibethinus]